MNVDAVVDNKKKTTMLDLIGSPSFNYEAAAVSLNTANARVSKNNKLRNINLSLEALGFAPGPVGLGADALNALLYSMQGKYQDAVLSSVAMVPVVGSVAASKKKIKQFNRVWETGLEENKNYLVWERADNDMIVITKDKGSKNYVVENLETGDRFDALSLESAKEIGSIFESMF